MGVERKRENERCNEGVEEVVCGGWSQDECRIISGPILPKCISIVAPEHVQMCVRARLRVPRVGAPARACDIVVARSAIRK